MKDLKNSMPTGEDGLGDGLQWVGWPETDMAEPTKIQDGVPGVLGLRGGLVSPELQPTPGFKSKKIGNIFIAHPNLRIFC